MGRQLSSLKKGSPEAALYKKLFCLLSIYYPCQVALKKIRTQVKGFLRAHLGGTAIQEGFQFAFVILVVAYILEVPGHGIVGPEQRASGSLGLLGRAGHRVIKNRIAHI